MLFNISYFLFCESELTKIRTCLFFITIIIFFIDSEILYKKK